MPARGGTAGKAGDRYEALWAVDVALRVVAGTAEHVTYESLDPEASRGVEFSVATGAGVVEFWSIKRQTAAASGWTLATLVRADEHGRSILGDLIGHVQRDTRNIAVFASMVGAATLEELRSVAETPDTLSMRLDQSKELKNQYDTYLVPLFGGDGDRARAFLTRLRVRTADECSLRAQIESMISLLFYAETGGPVDAAGVRRLLVEYMFDQLHVPISRALLLEHLARNGYRRKDWRIDETIHEKVAILCDAYAKPLREHLIGGTLQTLPGAEKLLGSDGLPSARRVLVCGGAGGGKSSELANVIDRLRIAGVPVLPVRLDQIDEGVLTPQRLGTSLSLPASPVAVLAGLADGGGCVLVVDQLDAVSLASGRRAGVWSLFEQLLTEADGYPHLRIVVACREFDLEHDHRMRALKAQSSAFTTVRLEPFSTHELDKILGRRKVHLKLRPLLVVPLHLAMFLSLRTEDSERLETRDELFGQFWTEKQRRTSQRLGRSCNFAGVVDQMAGWLSERQELSAPAHVLDTLREDADALTSEQVLVLADGRYRFFHETFFDYAFARRFASAGGRLLTLLVGSEQHLFRRAQVRQVLSFLRSNDPPRYIEELRSVLADGRVRFHLKRVVFQYLSALADPTRREWEVLRDLERVEPALRGHVRTIVAGHVGWFDVLDAVGYFDAGLSSGELTQQEHVIVLLSRPEILKQRPARVAALLSKHRRSDEAWRGYLRYVCRTGNVFHSREMFDLFLSLIRDGTLDGSRPGVTVNDNWWTGLYLMAEAAPALACEAIGTWFDRKMATWSGVHAHERPSIAAAGDCEESGGFPNSTQPEQGLSVSMWQHLGSDGSDHGVIWKAAKAPLAYAQQLLPRVAECVMRHAKTCRDRLEIDPLWSFRSFGDESYQVHAAILKQLARALEALARSAPLDLDRLLAPISERPHDAVAYLVLRAWSAAPHVYAERMATYFALEPRRLKIGYSSWGGDRGGEGLPEIYRSIQAVKVASTLCSIAAFTALEAAIVDLADEWEARHPQTRGLRQLQLLTAMDHGRLGPRGRAKLAELRAKFPDVTHEAPEPMQVRSVGSPIQPRAQEKMTDAQWLSAMAKYAGVDRRRNREFKASGGEYELSRALESRTKVAPQRFIDLSTRMPNDMPGSYFDAILRGVAAAASPEGSVGDAAVVTPAAVAKLVERVHALPGRPCGQWISHLVEKWKKVDWPSAVIGAVAWYATNDPDPTEETWRKRASTGQPYYGGDPFTSGLNSTRGAAVGAVAQLLFDDQNRTEQLLSVIDHLAHDPSIAVRSRAIEALLALLNTWADQAIQWFVECVALAGR